MTIAQKPLIIIEHQRKNRIKSLENHAKIRKTTKSVGTHGRQHKGEKYGHAIKNTEKHGTILKKKKKHTEGHCKHQ